MVHLLNLVPLFFLHLLLFKLKPCFSLQQQKPKPREKSSVPVVTSDTPMICKLENGKFQCILCLKTFGSLKAAKTHHAEKHIASSASYTCAYCSKVYSIERYLKQHLLSAHKITQKMLKNLVPTS